MVCIYFLCQLPNLPYITQVTSTTKANYSKSGLPPVEPECTYDLTNAAKLGTGVYSIVYSFMPQRQPRSLSTDDYRRNHARLN